MRTSIYNKFKNANHGSFRNKHNFLNNRNKSVLLDLGISSPSVIQKSIIEYLSHHKNYILLSLLHRK